jgi:SAM-dependent MidA family methyltransferase
LRVAGFTDQHHFLAGIISQSESGDSGQSLLADSRKAKRELQTLLHPEMLGRAFQVLALAKNAGPETNPLAGFKFARQLGQSG